MKKTKNDIAWEEIFKRYNILKKIKEQGFYEIEAAVIREYREPRLMCKFDHETNLPNVFSENNLSILPISRSAYVIGDFTTFAKVNYEKSKPKTVTMPQNIETIDSNNLYSESAALHCAYVTGMIDDFLGEDTVQTVSGRMGSGQFNYVISSQTDQNKPVKVNGAQIEIDGGYEGNSKFMIIEAKNEKVKDFNVRQLFYPYRVWKKRTNKQIVPTFFTYSNDVFSFFMYDFVKEDTFNSYKLIKQKDYIVEHETITGEDIKRVANSVTQFVEEPTIPFPQANDFKKVVDLLGFLYERDLTKEEIKENFSFVKRQADYYFNSCFYLGLADIYQTEEGVYATLNSEGKRIMELPYKQKYLSLMEKVLQHKVFKDVYDKFTEEQKRGKKVTNDYIVSRMKYYKLYNIQSDDTFDRRASTIRGWVKWIKELPELSGLD